MIGGACFIDANANTLSGDDVGGGGSVVVLSIESGVNPSQFSLVLFHATLSSAPFWAVDLLYIFRSSMETLLQMQLECGACYKLGGVQQNEKDYCVCP